MQRRHNCWRDWVQNASLLEGDTQRDVPDHYLQWKSQPRAEAACSVHFRAALQPRCERLLLRRRKRKEGYRGSLFPGPRFLRVLERKGPGSRMLVSLLREDKILEHRLPQPARISWIRGCGPPRSTLCERDIHRPGRRYIHSIGGRRTSETAGFDAPKISGVGYHSRYRSLRPETLRSRSGLPA